MADQRSRDDGGGTRRRKIYSNLKREVPKVYSPEVLEEIEAQETRPGGAEDWESYDPEAEGAMAEKYGGPEAPDTVAARAPETRRGTVRKMQGKMGNMWKALLGTYPGEYERESKRKALLTDEGE